MDYRRNEDHYPDNVRCGPVFNTLIDCQFIEGSGTEEEPVTVDEARQQAIIDDLVEDNDLIEAYITTARIQCETFTGMSFINREIVAVVNNSLGNIYLPYGPVKEVSSVVNKFDVAVLPENIKVLGVLFKQLEYPVNSWLKVTYSAGYDVLPKIFKTAILQQVAYLYEHRGDEKSDSFSPIAASLLKPHSRVSPI